MNYIYISIGLLFLSISLYRLYIFERIDETAIHLLEEKIEFSRLNLKMQQEKVKISTELSNNLFRARNIVDEKLLDLQKDLIEKLANKN